MRFGALLGTVTAGFFAAALTIAGDAKAATEYDVTSATTTELKVTANGDWHINADYPWKLTTPAPESKVVAAKGKFTFADMTASLPNPPAGTYTLKGAVCAKDGGSCKGFETSVTIK